MGDFLKWCDYAALVKSGLTVWDEVAGTYDRHYWRQVPPWDRTEWGRFLRIKRGDRDVKDVLAALVDHLSPAPSAATYSSWENRGAVPQQWQQAFRAMYEGGPETVPQAIKPKPQRDAGAPVGDLAALLSKLDRQAEVIDRLAAALERSERTNAATLKALDAAVRALAGDQLTPGVPTETGVNR